MSELGMNERAWALADRHIARAYDLRMGVRTLPSGARVIDAGVEVPGGLEAGLMLVAVGMGCFNSPNSSALFGSLPRERYGVGGAYQSLTRNLGQSIGQTMAAAIWTAVVMSSSGGLSTDAAPVSALLDGFSVAFTVAAGIVLCGAVLNAVVIWMFDMRRSTHAIIGGTLSLFIGLVIYMIASLDEPFRGPHSIKPDAIIEVHKALG